MPRYDPLPYEKPFTHGWDGDSGTAYENISRCRICHYGPETPRNLGYHYLDTHNLTVEQVAAAVAGSPMPNSVDADDLPM